MAEKKYEQMNSCRLSIRPKSGKRKVTSIQDKYRTSTVQVEQLITAIGEERLSVKEMLERMNLKHRENFLTNYL